ncbi:MAG: cytochrome-c peroxidase [Flavobacteriales bacterium]|nr:cytochrome-c peroxidase [Flavobacteriales bacterium]
MFKGKLRVAGFLLIILLVLFTNFSLGFKQYNISSYSPNESDKSSKIELGRKLFFDKMMSRDSSLSCASCHNPQFAFTDRKVKGIGIRGQELERNTPTLSNISNSDKFLWDGVNPSLVAQVMIPIHETNEFDFHINLIVERMKKDSAYLRLCNEAYGSDPNAFVITHSIAEFESILLSYNSPYDNFLKGDSNALTKSQLNGKDIFFNVLKCTKCHSGIDFTTYGLANNGLYENYIDSGRIRLTYKESDRAIFKIPTLRNIELTFPYMHDGSISNLEDVISHYSNGGENHQNKSEFITPFTITIDEKKDLINFLKSLTDTSFINKHSIFNN